MLVVSKFSSSRDVFLLLMHATSLPWAYNEDRAVFSLTGSWVGGVVGRASQDLTCQGLCLHW